MRGDETLTTMNATQRLIEAAERLHHLHLCEQEGIRSGAPNPVDWYEAVDSIGQALAAAKGESERKVLTGEEIALIAEKEYPERKGQSTKMLVAKRMAMAWGLRYARDNGYLAPTTGIDVEGVIRIAGETLAPVIHDEDLRIRGVEQFRKALEALPQAKPMGIDVEGLRDGIREAFGKWWDGTHIPSIVGRGDALRVFTAELDKALEAHAAENRGDNLRTDAQPMNVRGAVQWFAEQMEAALRRNDHKGGWTGMAEEALLHRVRDEVEEVRQAMSILRNRQSPATDGVATAEDFREVVRECADVANMAMMIADNIGPQIGQNGDLRTDPWISGNVPDKK